MRMDCATRFKPGQSGNPGGKPKGLSAVYALGRDRLPEIMAAMVELALDTNANPAARVAAAHFVTDRVLGKSPAVVKLDVDMAGLSNTALDAAIARELSLVTSISPLAIEGPPAADDADAGC